jgi:hypothetical protein
MLNWTPLDFITAITGTWILCIGATGVITTLSEFFELRLIEWWTGKKIK